MKLLKLELLAFGPFTNLALDLAEGSEGLHLVYGPNEAGKSSALRALKQLFFGIPARSADDFIHPHSKLRIGAVLANRSGAILELIRRKGNKNTLRQADDQTVLDDGALTQFLGGLDQAVFETTFCIDHATLVEGGRAIVEGGGQLGQVLFTAGSGIAGLRAVLQGLEKEADALFKPGARASLPSINQALAQLDLARKRVRDAALPSSQWVIHDRALTEALSRKQTVVATLEEKERQKHRLDRLLQALPALARRKQLLQELRQCSDAVILPKDFAEQRRQVLTGLHAAETIAEGARQALAGVARDAADLTVPDALLEQAPLLEQLHLRLGSHLKAVQDRSGLAAEQRQFDAEARSILRDLGRDPELNQAETMRLTAAERRRIQDLGNERLVRAKACEDALNEIAKLTRRIEDLGAERAQLPAARAPADLQQAVRRAQPQGALEQRLDEVQSALVRAEQQAAIDLQKLGLWSGTLEELEKLPVPAPEALDRFETDLAGVDSDLRSLRQQIDGHEQEQLDLEQQIEETRLQQEVPTEEDLEEARRRRDEGWQMVRRAWKEGGSHDAAKDSVEAFPPAHDQAEAFELSVQKADDVADRLRREADHVATKARLLAERKKCAERLEKLNQQAQQLETWQSELREEWSGLWQPTQLEPLAPREMRAWVRSHGALATCARAIREQRAQATTLAERIELHRRELGQLLMRLGEPAVVPAESLAGILERAQNLVEQIKAVETRRGDLQRNLAALEKDLNQARNLARDAQEKLSHWQADWAEAMNQLGLAAQATPSEANAVIGRVTDLFDKISQAESLRQRIAAIDQDAVQFTHDVRSLAGRVAADLATVPVEQAAAELHARLVRACTARTKLDTLTKQQLADEDRLATAGRTIADMNARLQGFCREARCRSPAELAKAEERSACRLRVEADLLVQEELLLRLSGGATLAEFAAEAEAVDADALRPQLAQLQEQLTELNNQKSELDQAIGSEKEILKKMDGGPAAAEAAQQVQSLLASIESGAEDYARLRLASAVLRQGIDWYREKNQGPVLKRASDLFADLTVASFQGLRLDVNERDQPVLMGVRTGSQETIALEHMSDGTSDQLYLALRLASLETFLERNEPIPFIVDDGLINFDDDRAVAALKALARLSEQTQVIFFTHHQHLVTLAKANLDDDVLFTHRPVGWSATAAFAVG